MRRIGLVLGLVLAIQVSPAAAADDAFVFRFERGQDNLGPRVREELREVAERYKGGGFGEIVIAGHTDRAGDDAYNIGLSQRRANNVRTLLVSYGIPEGLILTQAFGETRNAVETADGVVEPANNRVEITFGPGSGW